MSGHPEDLLRGALEKIVYFECRLSQLEAELAAARAVAAREKDATASARGREADLEAEMARARAVLQEAQSRSGELADRVRLLEGERERFLGGLIDQARIGAAPRQGEPPDEDRADLAGFIAELRAEVERLRPWKEAAEQAGLSLPDDPPRREARPAEAVPALAARFDAAGRIGLTPAEAKRLEAQLPTRAERTLYEVSMDDLASADAGARRRAADCLRALGSKAAAPLLAAAVGRERDPEVKAALLAALGAVAEPAAAEIARRALGDQRPQVRAAALEALASLAKDRAEPDLLRALGDPSPLVRRRAALLAGFLRGRASEDALASALADRDPSVARAVALALSGRPTARAQGALARALDHGEPGVRRAAADSVSRWSGVPVDAEDSSADHRRAARRIADKLAALSEVTLRDAVVAAAVQPRSGKARADAVVASQGEGARISAPTVAATATPTATSTVAATPAATAIPTPAVAPARVAAAIPAAPAPPSLAPAPLARTAVAVVDAPGPSDPLEEAVVGEIRAALRGRTLDELAAVVPGGHRAAEAALRSLVARGELLQRGARFFAS